MMSWLGENWPRLLSGVIGVAGVVVALVALYGSKEANRVAGEANQIAQRAVEQAQQAMIESQRPWLVAAVRKNKEGHVREVVRQPTHVEVRMNIELRNTGHSVAKRISPPEGLEAQGGHRVKVVPGFRVELGPTIDLAPGDSLSQTVSVDLTGDNLDALEADLRGDHYTFEFGTVWSYTSELDDRCYKTRLFVRLRLTEGWILKQEHETVPRGEGALGCPEQD